jgi:hypothetical protein
MWGVKKVKKWGEVNAQERPDKLPGRYQ